FAVDVASLEALPNVRLLGQQPYETMPHYLYHFDVCLIPFRISPTTDATDPVKLYEYFTAGKPVVATAMPELQPYRDLLYIASDGEDFTAKIDAALAETGSDLPCRRRAMAREHTWEERWQRIDRGLSVAAPRVSIVVVTYNNLPLTRL